MDLQVKEGFKILGEPTSILQGESPVKNPIILLKIKRGGQSPPPFTQVLRSLVM